MHIVSDTKPKDMQGKKKKTFDSTQFMDLQKQYMKGVVEHNIPR